MKIEIDFKTVDMVMIKELKRNYKSVRDDLIALSKRMDDKYTFTYLDNEWEDTNIPSHIWEDYNNLVNVLGSIEILLGYYMIASEAEAWLEKNRIKEEL